MENIFYTFSNICLLIKNFLSYLPFRVFRLELTRRLKWRKRWQNVSRTMNNSQLSSRSFKSEFLSILPISSCRLISINTFAKINFHICALQTSWVRISNTSSRTVDHLVPEPDLTVLYLIFLVLNLLTANTSHVFLSPELFSRILWCTNPSLISEPRTQWKSKKKIYL